MDPQQELFTAILTALRETDYGIYDTFIPGRDTEYPFIYIAETVLNDVNLKDCAIGNVSQVIHVWHNNPRKRGTLSKMLLDVKDICRKIESTDNFNWMVTSVNQQIIEDRSTEIPLMHGYLNIEFKFS